MKLHLSWQSVFQEMLPEGCSMDHLKSNVESAAPTQKSDGIRGDSKGRTTSVIRIVYFEIQPPLIRPLFCGHTISALLARCM